jgi:hypothetical protein
LRTQAQDDLENEKYKLEYIKNENELLKDIKKVIICLCMNRILFLRFFLGKMKTQIKSNQIKLRRCLVFENYFTSLSASL